MSFAMPPESTATSAPTVPPVPSTGRCPGRSTRSRAPRPALRAAVLAGLATVTAAAGTLVAASPATAEVADQTWDRVSRNRTVQDGQINENSGMSRSTYKRRVVFAHNDSGDGARFFAVGTNGQTVATFTLPGAPSRDWEDMASGPGHTLWFGDIGDNRHIRDQITVTRVQEPEVLTSRRLSSTTYQLRYPDGAHNAEGLMVRWRTGLVYVVTKGRNGGAIYRAPARLDPDRVNTLTRVRSVPSGLTGADFAPRSRMFVLRGYGRAWLYDDMGTRPTAIDLPSQRQGESVAFARGRPALLIGSEGVRQPIWRIQ